MTSFRCSELGVCTLDARVFRLKPPLLTAHGVRGLFGPSLCGPSSHRSRRGIQNRRERKRESARLGTELRASAITSNTLTGKVEGSGHVFIIIFFSLSFSRLKNTQIPIHGRLSEPRLSTSAGLCNFIFFFSKSMFATVFQPRGVLWRRRWSPYCL